LKFEGWRMKRDIKGAVFVFSENGALVFSSQEGLGKPNLRACEENILCMADIFDEPTVSMLLNYQNQDASDALEGRCILSLQSDALGCFKVEAELCVRRAQQQALLFITVLDVADAQQVEFTREDDFIVLSDIINTFAIPTWCIEFREFVDISVTDREIVRQIFLNDSCWRLCNKAFAQLYDLPDNLDFNQQPVSSFFPRTPENEQFMLEVIENDFEVDNALSIDTHHDGSALYIENCVRAHIENGKLLRLWGTARDVTREKRTENRLIHKETEVREVLSSIPDVILVVNRLGVLQGANPAFENQFGWNVDDWLGKDVNEIINLKGYLRGRSRLKADQQIRFTGKVAVPDLSERQFDVSLSCFLDEMDEERFVGVFRPVKNWND